MHAHRRLVLISLDWLAQGVAREAAVYSVQIQNPVILTANFPLQGWGSKPTVYQEHTQFTWNTRSPAQLRHNTQVQVLQSQRQRAAWGPYPGFYRLRTESLCDSPPVFSRFSPSNHFSTPAVLWITFDLLNNLPFFFIHNFSFFFFFPPPRSSLS